MAMLWDAGPLSVRAVTDRLRGKLAYTTVMTTMDRLHKKGLLHREKDGNAFIYSAAMDRAEYRRRVVEAAVSPLLEEEPGSVLAAFVDVAAGLDEAHLAKLERLIAEHRKRR
jgi:predicted transcriptional regulator